MSTLAAIACAAPVFRGVKDPVSFLRERTGRFAMGVSDVSLVKLLLVSICTITDASVCSSLLSNALWVKRLARWVGAGGNGMSEGLLMIEKIER
jgi:hypothetical protein